LLSAAQQSATPRTRVGAARPKCSGPKDLDPDAFFPTIGVAP
jgi:hypothetical protein